MCNMCEEFDRREFLYGSTSAAALAFLPQIATADIYDFPRLIPRESWSLVAPKSSPGSTKQYALSGKPRYVSVHYTSFYAKHSTYSARDLVRNLQTGHMNEGFGDIAYHYIVTLPGEIYEGRPINIAPASKTYYHSEAELKGAEFLPDGRLAVTGKAPGIKPGHTDSHITVSFNLGIGKPDKLPIEVMEQGARLIARLLFENGLTPKDVRAHREFAKTTCPGDEVYTWLRGNKMRRETEGPGMIAIKMEFERLKNS